MLLLFGVMCASIYSDINFKFKGGILVPNIASAKKRVRVIKKKTLRNKMVKSNLKTVLKKTFSSIENKASEASQALQFAMKKLDKAAAKGIIHKNKAANKKSQLQRAFNKA